MDKEAIIEFGAGLKERLAKAGLTADDMNEWLRSKGIEPKSNHAVQARINQATYTKPRHLSYWTCILFKVFLHDMENKK